MYTLGISCFYHDAAISLTHKGLIKYASHEERYTRIKHDKSFPFNALADCISIFNLDINNIESIVFYENPLLKHDRRLKMGKTSNLSFDADIVNSLSLASLISKCTGWQKDCIDKKLLFSQHHLSHAASSYFCSGFSDSAILVVDAVGELETVSIYKASAGKLTKLWSLEFPQSIGLFYSALTYYCGFKVNSGEYKLMGLAPYGKPLYAEAILNNFFSIRDIENCNGDPLRIDPGLYSIDSKTSIVQDDSRLSEILGFPPRKEVDKMTQETP